MKRAWKLKIGERFRNFCHPVGFRFSHSRVFHAVTLDARGRDRWLNARKSIKLKASNGEARGRFMPILALDAMTEINQLCE